MHNGLIDKRPALIARCRTVPGTGLNIAWAKETFERLGPYLPARQQMAAGNLCRRLSAGRS